MSPSYSPQWPPGTIRLQTLTSPTSSSPTTTDTLVLQPRPTRDPNDPLNWSRLRKNLNFALACLYSTLVFAFVNATSPTWGPLADELGFSDKTLTDTYAIGCATLAVGAPMLIPFALKFGSRPVYTLSSLLQCVISVWAARTMTVGDWWGVNATQCFLGALCEVLAQITIADLFFVHERGRKNSWYIWAYNIGSNLAVMVAGFVTQGAGWRWVWWIFAILFGAESLLFFVGFEETKWLQLEVVEGREVKTAGHAERLGEKNIEKTQSGTHEPDGGELQTVDTLSIDPNIPRKTYWQRMAMTTTSPGPWSEVLRHSWQPFIILFTIPGVAFAALVYGILTAWSTVMTTAVSTYMLDAPYTFDAAQIGLMSLAPFVGSTIGSLIVGPVSDYVAVYLSKRNGGIYEPEMRFWVFLPFIPFQLAGAWWFAYALDGGKPWPQVAVAYGMANFGAAPIMSLALTYLLDAYNEIVGDALTAVTIVRNTFSTIFVFAMPAWIARTGIPNVFNAIGAIGLLILSFSAVFIWKGKHFRWRFADVYSYYAKRQFEARPI
ncbi:major facilitator superfamily domain-containing protein [Elsinoe ampelina]|uniref:Major facilitator superfamily domain-containing protein n=1 Tax=Elsinoe ampelina TaxID=302913 RepID=A0A6A6G8C7_9PEZI|nr:major facilitator superfamily domain-containing protein [Elsinoe ampelina]